MDDTTFRPYQYYLLDRGHASLKFKKTRFRGQSRLWLQLYVEYRQSLSQIDRFRAEADDVRPFGGEMSGNSTGRSYSCHAIYIMLYLYYLRARDTAKPFLLQQTSTAVRTLGKPVSMPCATRARQKSRPAQPVQTRPRSPCAHRRRRSGRCPQVRQAKAEWVAPASAWPMMQCAHFAEALDLLRDALAEGSLSRKATATGSAFGIFIAPSSFSLVSRLGNTSSGSQAKATCEQLEYQSKRTMRLSLLGRRCPGCSTDLQAADARTCEIDLYQITKCRSYSFLITCCVRRLPERMPKLERRECLTTRPPGN